MTSSILTMPFALFIVPVVLVLGVLLVVMLGKSHKTEVIPAVPIPPVTTVAQPEPGSNVISDASSVTKEPTATVLVATQPILEEPPVPLAVPSWRPVVAPMVEEPEVVEVVPEPTPSETPVPPAPAVVPSAIFPSHSISNQIGDESPSITSPSATGEEIKPLTAV